MISQVWNDWKKAFPFDTEIFRNFQADILAEWKAPLDKKSAYESLTAGEKNGYFLGLNCIYIRVGADGTSDLKSI